MITAYVGLPGSGKSYGVCEQVILPALAKGRPVFTNIPFDTNLCKNLSPIGFLMSKFEVKILVPKFS